MAMQKVPFKNRFFFCKITTTPLRSIPQSPMVLWAPVELKISNFSLRFQDVCGMFCACLTWGLIFYANFVVLNVVLLPYPSPYSVINTVLFLSVTTLAVSSHLRTMLSDPGMSKSQKEKNNFLTFFLYRCCATWQCHQGIHTIAIQRRNCHIQVSKMLQYKA